jgi:DNA-binding transcriptional regulator YiaG
MTTKLRCGECGERRFERQNVKGQFSTPWRDFPHAYLTKDLRLLVCGNCANYAIDDDDADQIDLAMDASVRDQTSQFIDVIKSKANITAMKLASLVGITPEYLSMIYNGKRTPSFQVWNLLKLVATDPVKLTAELDPGWDIRKKNLLLRA